VLSRKHVVRRVKAGCGGATLSYVQRNLSKLAVPQDALCDHIPGSLAMRQTRMVGIATTAKFEVVCSEVQTLESAFCAGIDEFSLSALTQSDELSHYDNNETSTMNASGARGSYDCGPHV
jgi:hypothetical protein